jgi:hypothetical protein
MRLEHERLHFVRLRRRRLKATCAATDNRTRQVELHANDRRLWLSEARRQGRSAASRPSSVTPRPIDPATMHFFHGKTPDIPYSMLSTAWAVRRNGGSVRARPGLVLTNQAITTFDQRQNPTKQEVIDEYDLVVAEFRSRRRLFCRVCVVA